VKIDSEKYMKGTTTIGVICSDGVVIGADTRATMGDYVANSEVRKIFKIDNNLGMTVAGGVGDAQEIIRIIKAQNEMYKMNENRPMSPKSTASLLSIILQQNKMMPYYVMLIVGGLEGDDPQIYSIDPLGGATEESNFTVTGSGTEVAIGYIEDSYKKGLTTKDAIKIVARALSIAKKRVSSTGDSMMIATITKTGYMEYNGKDLEKMLGAK
jgi:proteasome beta subunit